MDGFYPHLFIIHRQLVTSRSNIYTKWRSPIAEQLEQWRQRGDNDDRVPTELMMLHPVGCSESYRTVITSNYSLWSERER
jgi:hypothetical protein